MEEGNRDRITLIINCQVLQVLRYFNSLPQHACNNAVLGTTLSNIVSELLIIRRNQTFVTDLVDIVRHSLETFSKIKIVRRMEGDRYLLIDEARACNYCDRKVLDEGMNQNENTKTTKKRCNVPYSKGEPKRRKQNQKKFMNFHKREDVSPCNISPPIAVPAQSPEPNCVAYTVNGTYTFSPGEVQPESNGSENRGVFVIEGVHHTHKYDFNANNTKADGTFVVGGTIYNPSQVNDKNDLNSHSSDILNTYVAKGTYTLHFTEENNNDRGTYVAHGTYTLPHNEDQVEPNRSVQLGNFVAQGTFMISRIEHKFSSNVPENYEYSRPTPYIGTFVAQNNNGPSLSTAQMESIGSENLSNPVTKGSFTLTPNEVQLENADENAENHERSENDKEDTGSAKLS